MKFERPAVLCSHQSDHDDPHKNMNDQLVDQDAAYDIDAMDVDNVRQLRSPLPLILTRSLIPLPVNDFGSSSLFCYYC